MCDKPLSQASLLQLYAEELELCSGVRRRLPVTSAEGLGD